MPGGKRSRPRTNQTPSASTPAGELQRHLTDLGLSSADAYRAWCRENGFGTALRKSWQQRRDEVRAAARQSDRAKADERLTAHYFALGHTTRAAYDAWCNERGLPTASPKSPAQLRDEMRLAQQERAGAAVAAANRQNRRPADTIEVIASGHADSVTMRAPYVRAIAAAFVACDGAAMRDAFRRLLLAASRDGTLLAVGPAYAQLETNDGNTFIGGLRALASRHAGWIRAPETWLPASKSPHRQFGSLARHLTSRYYVPRFMDSVWFLGASEAARRRQGWFAHIGQGQNIRTADAPIHLTKRMAHHFLQAPEDLGVDAALRWAQVVGMGGDARLAHAILATLLGTMQEDEPFWATFVRFLINNPLLDTDFIGPMVDYIHQRRFAPAQIAAEEGAVQIGPPIDPGFSMKGRTALALLRLVEEWHRTLAREKRASALQWESSGIGGYTVDTVSDDAGPIYRWEFLELLTRDALREEGREMRHCVASYARRCAAGTTSIWSLRAGHPGSDRLRSMLTIEVNNRQRTIVQARGRCNRSPGARLASTLLNTTPEIVRRWAAQERLTVPSHLFA